VTPLPVNVVNELAMMFCALPDSFSPSNYGLARNAVAMTVEWGPATRMLRTKGVRRDRAARRTTLSHPAAARPADLVERQFIPRRGCTALPTRTDRD